MIHRVDTLAPDAPELADAAAGWRSAYVHIPFCRRRCPYCDFAVVAADEIESDRGVERYVRAVRDEVAREPRWHALDAVNFGGGTPSTLRPRELASIVESLRSRFGLASDAEISLEANPEDWSPAYGDTLAAAGFTRVSFGVQSFDAGVLGSLGRLHDPDQADAAVRAAAASGFTTVSVDLIFGTPGESDEAWRRTVERALALPIDHLSAYALTVERGTALSRAVAAGAPAPDPDRQADAWELVDERAHAAGLVRYEVSNWAKPGHACRYNLGTWAGGEYLGFGLGAHGHRGHRRTRNLRRLDAYLAAVEEGRPPVAGAEIRTGWDAEIDRLFVGLRRTAGARIGGGGARLLASPEGERLAEAGVVAVRGDRIVVTKPLLTDAVSRAVLSLSPRDC